MPKRTPAAILRRTAVVVLVLAIVIAGLWLAGRAALLYTYGPNALSMAIDSRDADQVEYLLKLGADPNKPDDTGVTPLAQVLSPRSGLDPNALEIIQLLLRFGADPEGTTTEGQPFLFEALTKRPPNIAQALLDAGADPNIQLPDGESVLTYLIRQPYIRNLGNADRVSMLIDAGAEVGPWEAILLGDLDRLKRMIDRDPNLIHRPLLHGGTALHAAAYSANQEIARYLLDLGAQPNAQNETGTTPLHAALDQEYAPTRPALIREEVAKLLLEQGAQPTLADDLGNTPLHFAARYGAANTVDLLLKLDADPRQENNSGETPIAVIWPYFHLGPRSENIKEWLDSILGALVKRGAPLNVEGPYGYCPLALAAESASPSIVELMLNQGADPNYSPPRHVSPLHVANPENTQVLIKHGATVDLRDPRGETPLFRALTRDGDVIKVQLLLEAGANVHLNNHDNVSPLDAAKSILKGNARYPQFQHSQEAARLILQAAGIDPAELE